MHRVSAKLWTILQTIWYDEAHFHLHRNSISNEQHRFIVTIRRNRRRYGRIEARTGKIPYGSSEYSGGHCQKYSKLRELLESNQFEKGCVAHIAFRLFRWAKYSVISGM